jgi:hypothetical protein
MELAIIGFVTAFNFIIVYWKFQNGRVADGVLDLTIFGAIAAIFAGTVSGLTVGMIASFLVSLFLLMRPPSLDNLMSGFKPISR